MRRRTNYMSTENYFSKEKILVRDEIAHFHADKPFTWADIKHIDFQDTDEISLHYEEAYYSENNSWDAHYSGSVIRSRMETEEEFEERQKDVEEQRYQLKERRRANYLKLKEEFEPESVPKSPNPGFGSGGG
jgi:hypothetical protein